MRGGEPQTEALRAFGQAAQVAAPVEQVVDELAPGGLFLAYGEELGPVVALGEGVDDLLDRRERAVGGTGRGGPGGARRGEVGADEGGQSVPGVGGAFAE